MNISFRRDKLPTAPVLKKLQKVWQVDLENSGPYREFRVFQFRNYLRGMVFKTLIA
ncbi:hypothetical protein Pan161_47720 [Gimesia algae]|uniref:Uncharacterized protein n=1 Tax=Gimesia algae TaxID=2527971 RepID=A0A517VJB6_9PLAN|nr:hypothetical protein Pan161_47720 [Gimesia algae]